MLRYTCAVSGLFLLLGGCACGNKDAVNDPLEPINREVFAFNRSLDVQAALPAATYYRSAVPSGAREGIHNFLSNLSLPVTFANDALQGQMTLAGEAACRFGVNISIGVLGVMDPATDMGCPEHDQDFGLTLASYGVPGGPYMVLPLLGPTMPRDLIGKFVVDHYFNPLGYVTYDGKFYVSLTENLVKLVDQRSRHVGELRDVERNSIDYYASMRSLYYQKREPDFDQSNVAPGASKTDVALEASKADVAPGASQTNVALDASKANVAPDAATADVAPGASKADVGPAASP
jgi:phospholipid-binding lipoprotein MlaA